MPQCNALHNHLCLDTDSRFRPCCSFQRTQEVVNVGHLEWNEYKNSDFYRDVQQQMETGWHPNCSGCRIDEEAGKLSPRMNMNRDLSGDPDKLEYIDISFDNECNLTCKMCGPQASSRWERLIEKNISLTKYHYYQPVNHANRTILEVLATIDFSNIKFIKLQGGEPFIGNHLSVMINEIKKKTSIENVNLSTSTNCTVFPKEIISDLVKFNMLVVSLSIDGFDDLCDYIRTGQPWNKVSKVVEKWLELAKSHSNIHLTVSHTLQALNLHQFVMIKQWAKDNGIDFYYDLLKYPTELSIHSLPENYVMQLRAKQLLDTDLENALNSESPRDPSKLLKFLQDQDAAMKTDLARVIPDLYQSLSAKEENYEM